MDIQMRSQLYLLSLSALLISACDSNDDPVTNGGMIGGATAGSNGGTEGLACSTDEDCKDANLPNASMSFPTCSDMVLQIPSSPVCGAEGMCVINLDLTTRDCAAEGLVCAPKDGDPGSDCLDPQTLPVG